MRVKRPLRFEEGTGWAQIASTLDLARSQIHELARRSERRTGATNHLDTVRQIGRARQARARIIGKNLFGEPAWDMLLELYALSLEQHECSVSSICLASGAPPTTALRWLDKLQGCGLVVREDDTLDARRTWVRLSDEGLSRMRRYFDLRECAGTSTP